MISKLITNNIFSIVISFLLTYIATPIMKRIAIKYNIVDIPNYRKSHKKNTPYLGGVAIFLGSIISIILFSKPDTDYVIPVMTIALFTIMLMGLLDDIKDLSAKFRLSFLFLTATGVVIAFQFFNYGSMLTYGFILNALFIIITIIWIVAIANAINWSDGLDGLASSQALISAIGFAIMFWMQGRNQLSLPIALSLVGALLGFLPHNISPAKIFMGDAGSMFVGFLLGVLSIISINDEGNYFALIVPIFFIMMPVLDMSIVMLRRKLNNRSMMAADKTHFHHILNRKYNNQRIVVLIISLFQLIFVSIGLIIYYFHAYFVGWVALIIGAMIVIVLVFIQSKKKSIEEIEN